MLQYLLGILLTVNITIISFSKNYISELAISFLPYLIVINILWMVISFISLRIYLKKTTISKVKRNIRWVLLIWFGILFIIHSNTFNKFYNYETWVETTPSSSIKVLYANIHKDNTDYSWIKKTIQDTNPDLILFVEFSENHYTHLKDFLQTRYPYINSTTRSKKFIGSMVFSKYKIENWANNFPQGRWRYAYFSIQKEWPQQYFYLIHTSSPDSYAHFDMRNKQLTSFINDFQSHQKWYRAVNDKVFIVWDFNITPRSPYYKEFENWLGTWLINITRQFPIVFTRTFAQLPIFRAHIDHIRSNDADSVQEIKTVKIPGSDHKWFTFTIANP